MEEINKFIWLENKNIRTILDIGANIGQFSTVIHKVLPNAAIYAFEPLKDCYEELLNNMRDVPNFKAFNFALGEEDSEAEIYRNKYSHSSSLLHMADLHKQAFPCTKNITREEIIVKRLDGIVDTLLLENDLLIKIDVQGYEDKVILGGYKVISKARMLIVETSFQVLYYEQPLFATIFDMLRKMDFAYCGNLDQIRNPIDGSVLQADSIFMRLSDGKCCNPCI